MSDKMLDKLAKLLKQAENAGTSAEAEAFMSKAQHLATSTSIDLAVARAHTAKREQREQPTQKAIRIGERGKKGLKFYVDLFLAVGQANDVKFTIAGGATYVYAYGMPSDIEVTEVLYASLVFQMVESATAYLKSGEHKKEIVSVYCEPSAKNDYMGGYEQKPMDGRVARGNFYQGFTQRVGRRLYDARREAQEAVQEQQYAVLNEADEEVKTTGALVLKAKREEVDEFYGKETKNCRGTYSGASTSQYSVSSRSAGDNAGRSARLGSNKSIANRTSIG